MNTPEPQGLVEGNLALADRLARRFMLRHLWLDRDDVRQTAYLGLCEAASRFDGTRGAAFRTFAHATILGYLRNLRISEQKQAAGSLATEPPEPDRGGTVADVTYQAVHTALAKLPARQRNLLTQRYGLDAPPRRAHYRWYYGRQVRQIAREHGVSEGTAANHIARATKELRRILTAQLAAAP